MEPTFVEGKLHPEILEAIKTSAAEDENQQEVITAKLEPAANRESNAGGIENVRVHGPTHVRLP